MKQEHCFVVEQIAIAENIYKLTLQGEIVSEMKEPGQFVHLKVTDGIAPLLRRPISISNIDQKNKQFSMIYRKDGIGTSRLAENSSGMSVDVLGPLGNGFPVATAKQGSTVILVGGGIGVPPLYELSRQLKDRGVNVIHVLGFQTENVVFGEEDFMALGETYIVTADGTYGYKGFVTDVLKEFQWDFDTMYACGPTPMLKVLATLYPNKEVFLSLEERMGCGIGACFACVCHLKDDPNGYSYKKVCSDGPVFRAGEVVL
ncbi:dihydroorotate dehydrogenase electron transfer subunit [Pseudoneobacillus sp. C159]